MFKPLLAALVVSIVLLTAVLPTTPARAQFEDEFQPGLIGEYTDADGQRLTRIDPRVSFAWGDRPPAAGLGDGPFTVRWSGYLMSQASGEYRLYAYAQGRVSIVLDGETLLDAEAKQPGWLESDPISIPFDFHDFEVTFRKTGDRARLALFWSGPQFQLEPLANRLFHDIDADVDQRLERGGRLVRALRCAACHEIPGRLPPSPAPALDGIGGAVSRAWLIDWLTSSPEKTPEQTETAAGQDSGEVVRRMPHFDLSDEQARAVTAFLLRDARPLAKLQAQAKKSAPAKKKGKKESTGKKPRTEAQKRAEGERLLLATGCLACHRVGEFGSSGLFGGGDLTRIAEKRPAAFFARWLADPSQLNRDHRMPVFELSATERDDLALYLASLGEPADDEEFRAADADDRLIAEGRRLVAAFRCAACHRLDDNETTVGKPAELPTPAKRLDGDSKWSAACTAAPDPDRRRPGYRLSEVDRAAVERFVAATAEIEHRAEPAADGAYLLAEHNCLACHLRGDSQGLAPKLTAVAAQHPELAEFVPAMTPPPLVSVGDKLHESALTDAIRRKNVHRPWLQVRMPKFDLNDEQLATLVRHFIDTDRIPDRPTTDRSLPEQHILELAGARLVTPDGFGCTSCHRVGSVAPVKAPLNARGPDLSMLDKRIRRAWFDRWVRNPARIVPNMEMPSVQLPVRGVLDEHLADQLEAVWTVLNTPGFEPPEPNPVRVVRRSGIEQREEAAAVLTDVLTVDGRTFIKPLLVGLPNRHNVLLDLETSRLAAWWMGDTARQRTKGKTWYWEAAGSTLPVGDASPWPTATDMQLLRGGIDGEVESPHVVGQFPTEIDALRHVPQGIEFDQRLHFRQDTTLHIAQTLTGIVHNAQGGAAAAGFRREVVVRGVPQGDAFALDVLASPEATLSSDGRTAALSGPEGIALRLTEPAEARFTRDGDRVRVVLAASGPEQRLRFAVQYTSNLPVDRYPLEVAPVEPPEALELNIVPGYQATRLPLADEFMPTGFAWRSDGTLVITSLKGRVWQAQDTDGDELEDRLSVFSDELAAPFGAAAADDYIDVINKYALLRLYDEDGDGRAERMTTLASGWGHTADYHDWAVGLPRDERGNYYIGLPCQQDDRSPAAAVLRGTVVRLAPRQPTDDDPRRFALQPLSGGHRFPIGIALNRRGDLFVTDNQGNYNPFNELNHVRQGARYGFINKLERRPGFQPPLTPPAVDIPHPWTRSVNGICFLDTPRPLAQKLGRDLFGPFEGHLVGCEYDTRRLIRISLQRIGDTYQGAAYPFSFDEPSSGPPMLGPLTCAVAPDGDLYVGSIRDSGWGGANNIGELVRLRPAGKRLPAGIAEVRAVADGFEIDFTRPVARRLAEDPQNYNLASYTRVSTPAYGGPDVDRRTEKIRAVSLSADGLRAKLRLDELREGFVYEIQLKPLVDSGPFFPAEAYYTLRRIPR